MNRTKMRYGTAWVVGALVAAGAGPGWGAEPAAAPAAPAAASILKSLDAKIYGVAHVSADLLDDGEASDLYLSSNSSRLGFKGEKGLSEWISAIWQIEAEVRFDEKDENDLFATRDTYAGLSCTELGRVVAGRVDTPFKSMSRKTDLFGDRIGDTRNLTSTGGAGWDLRPDNFILATSRQLGGFTAQAGQKLADGPDETGLTSLGVTYGGKAGFIGAAYEQHAEGMTPIDTNKDGTNDSPSEASESGLRIGGSLKLGSLTLSALYQYLQDVAGKDGEDRTTWGGGAAYAIGRETLKAQCYVTDGGTADEVGSILSVVGVDHAFSDNVTLYLAYARMDNEAKAKATMSGGGHGDKVTPAKGNDPTGVSLGLICKF